MKTVYPNIEWTETRPNVWIGTAEGFELRAGLSHGGPRAGKWTGILNHGAIQTGSGEHGYEFPSMEATKAALETEMKRRVDAKVQQAMNTIMHYTQGEVPSSEKIRIAIAKHEDLHRIFGANAHAG